MAAEEIKSIYPAEWRMHVLFRDGWRWHIGWEGETSLYWPATARNAGIDIVAAQISHAINRLTGRPLQEDGENDGFPIEGDAEFGAARRSVVGRISSIAEAVDGVLGSYLESCQTPLAMQFDFAGGIVVARLTLANLAVAGRLDNAKVLEDVSDQELSLLLAACYLADAALWQKQMAMSEAMACIAAAASLAGSTTSGVFKLSMQRQEQLAKDFQHKATNPKGIAAMKAARTLYSDTEKEALRARAKELFLSGENEFARGGKPNVSAIARRLKAEGNGATETLRDILKDADLGA